MIYTSEILEVLHKVDKACKSLGVDFYIIGAVARDIHLSKDSSYVPRRRTMDLDVAVMVSSESEFQGLKEELINKHQFNAHKETIKLIYHQGTELDLLPFSDIEENGYSDVSNPKCRVVDFPAIDLLFNHAEYNQISENSLYRVCSIEGLVLLKLIAYDEKPERTKDLVDIRHLIEAYFHLMSDRIFDAHFDLLVKYDSNDPEYREKVCAHAIGRQIARITKVQVGLFEKTRQILAKNKDRYWDFLFIGLIDQET